MNNNNNPSNSSKENSSFQGLWPPPTTTTNNVAVGDNQTRSSPPINVPGEPRLLPPNNVPGANEIRPHPPPMLNVPGGANETNERPKKKKKRTREIIVGGDPIMTTLRLGSDPNMQFVVGSTSKPKSKSAGKKPIDPNAPKITCPCAECGKSFWSWKALFGHMRCHPERTWRGIIPPENRQQRNDGASTSANPPPRGSGLGRVNMNEEDQEVATGLLMLANGLLSIGGGQFLNDQYQGSPESVDSAAAAVAANENHVYECSSCKRVFGSHQALGGHRASHKKVKGCFAIAAKNSDESNNENRNNEDDNSNGTGSNDIRAKGKGKAKVTDEQGMVLGHRCGVCGKIFASGQALGGHMRCHWERGENSSSSSVMLPPQQQQQGAGILFNPSTTAGCSTSYAATTRGGRNGTTGYALDLNLPPPNVPEPEPELEPEAAPPAQVDDAKHDEDSSSSSTSSSEMDLDLKLGF